jgi:hypothetical protein
MGFTSKVFFFFGWKNHLTNFERQKITLNLLAFCFIAPKNVKQQTYTLPHLGLSRATKSGPWGCTIWEGQGMKASKQTKHINQQMPILIYRCTHIGLCDDFCFF